MSGLGAGCPGWRDPASEVFCEGRRMSGLTGLSFCSLDGLVRMSGLDAGCPGPIDLAAGPFQLATPLGAGCPGSWPDVRALGAVPDSFRWFSSSMNLGTCPPSCPSSRGFSWYLIMHNISDLGSSHVSRGSNGISLRRDVTSFSRALARACAIGPLGT